MKLKEHRDCGIHFAEGGYSCAVEIVGAGSYDPFGRSIGFSTRGRAQAALVKEINRNGAGYIPGQLFAIYQEPLDGRFYTLAEYRVQ